MEVVFAREIATPELGVRGPKSASRPITSGASWRRTGDADPMLSLDTDQRRTTAGYRRKVNDIA
jgi:hypothetical protein